MTTSKELATAATICVEVSLVLWMWEDTYRANQCNHPARQNHIATTKDVAERSSKGEGDRGRDRPSRNHPAQVSSIVEVCPNVHEHACSHNETT